MPGRLPITALLLAGGKSTRMGRDKTLLPFGKGTLLSHMRERLDAFCAEVIVCGGASGIPDRHPGIGPLGGLESGLRAARHEWCLVVGCDMPAFSEDLTRLLWAAAQNTQAWAVIPESPNGREPLHSLVRRPALPAIERAIEEGRFGMEQTLQENAYFLSWSQVQAICPDASCFRNWNRPEDILSAEELAEMRA